MEAEGQALRGFPKPLRIDLPSLPEAQVGPLGEPGEVGEATGEDGEVRPLHQEGLGPEVGLGGAVEVQVVVGVEVHEDPHPEGEALHPLQGQGVAGDLQHGAFQAAVRRLPEEGVDLGGFRGGEVAHGGAGLLAQAEAHGGEEGASALGPL